MSRACAHGDPECAGKLLADSSAADVNMGVLRKGCRLSASFLQAAYSRGGSDNRGSDNRGSPEGRSGGSAEQLQALAMLSGHGMLTSNGTSRPAGSLRSNSGSISFRGPERSQLSGYGHRRGSVWTRSAFQAPLPQMLPCCRHGPLLHNALPLACLKRNFCYALITLSQVQHGTDALAATPKT